MSRSESCRAPASSNARAVRGSFVAAGLTEEPLRERYTLTRTVPDASVEPDSDILEASFVLPPHDVREHLGIKRGSRAVHVERVRMYGAQPTALHSSWLPSEFARPLLDEDLRQGAFYELLDKYCGVRVTSGWERVTIVMPTKEQRELLQIAT